MEFFLFIWGLFATAGAVWFCIAVAVDDDFRRKVFSRKRKEPSEPHPTKYQTEPPTLAMEIHRGKHAVILKTRNDRTVVRQEDMMALSDELRKYHTTISTLNEIIGMDDINAEETTQNEPPDPNALPERVDVKGWDGKNLKDIHDAVPDAGYAGRSLYRMMSEMPGAADYIAERYPNLAPPEYWDSQRLLHNKVTNLIMEKGGYMDYATARSMASQYIDHCRDRGVDPIQGIQGKV